MKKVFLCTMAAMLSVSVAMPLSGASFDQGLFESYAENLKNIRGVELKRIRGFKEMEVYHSYWLSAPLPTGETEQRERAGDLFGPVLLSVDGQCAIAYGEENADGGFDAGKRVRFEIESNCTDTAGNVCPVNLENRLTVKEIPTLGSIYIYDFPNVANMEIRHTGGEFPDLDYKCCIGVIVERAGVSLCHFKLFMTEKGSRRAKRYVKKLLGSISVIPE